jgi:hypothetical protein
MVKYGNRNTDELHYSTAKVTVHGQTLVPIIIRREHHVTFTSPIISRLRKTKSFCRQKSGQTCGIKSSHTSGDVYPDKCWFAVLCRFWPQCSQTLTRRPRQQPGSAIWMGRPWLPVIAAVEDHPLLAVHDSLFNILAPTVSLTEQNCSPGGIKPSWLLSFVIG